MIILSIDPGIEKTGFALLKKTNSQKKFYFIESGLIKTKKKLSLEKRIFLIYESLKKIFQKYKPSVIVYEEIFFFKNRKTIIAISQMQGLILLLAAMNNIPVEKLSPLMIKQAVTGYGLADKKSIKRMVDQEIKLNKKIEDDEYDAIACGLAYCYLNKKLF
mgnify:CR=1 FL=1